MVILVIKAQQLNILFFISIIVGMVTFSVEVEDLIERNKEKFKDEEVEFRCLNIAVDELPSGDCVLIRQVLQHLSNAEVDSILNKLSDYKYIIITEHVPIGDFDPNVDIISGQGTRLKKKSGLGSKHLSRIGNGCSFSFIFYM